MAEPARHPLGAPLAPGTAGFGTDGIRGRVGQLITPALALQLGFWLSLIHISEPTRPY